VPVNPPATILGDQARKDLPRAMRENGSAAAGFGEECAQGAQGVAGENETPTKDGDDMSFTVMDTLPADLRAERRAAVQVVRDIAGGHRPLRDLPRPRSLAVKAGMLDACVATHDGEIITAAAAFLWETLATAALARVLCRRREAADHLQRYLWRRGRTQELQALWVNECLQRCCAHVCDTMGMVLCARVHWRGALISY